MLEVADCFTWNIQGPEEASPPAITGGERDRMFHVEHIGDPMSTCGDQELSRCLITGAAVPLRSRWATGTDAGERRERSVRSPPCRPCFKDVPLREPAWPGEER